MSELSKIDLDNPLQVALAWSALIEPGDLAAGMLRRMLGPASALELIIQRPQEVFAHQELGYDKSGKPRPWKEVISRWAPRLQALNIAADWEQGRKSGARVILPTDSNWPKGLNDLGDSAPPLLWVIGQMPDLNALAVVGARVASRYGEKIAADIAVEASDKNISVISGGAFGIDQAAHRGALAAQGHTVAVMAGGLGNLYPMTQIDLLTTIGKTGALISEVPPSWRPAKWRFLARNRLIAALSQATVVVEAGVRSGALATARHARTLARPIGAVPGPITSPSSAGCLGLIREDAICVASAGQALELVSPINGEETPGPTTHGVQLPLDELQAADPAMARVIDTMPLKGKSSISVIARKSGLAEREVMAALGRLELKGLIERVDNKWGLHEATGSKKLAFN